MADDNVTQTNCELRMRPMEQWVKKWDTRFWGIIAGIIGTLFITLINLLVSVSK
jgi:hypothetical protein